jgi:hypothetical protein
MTKTENLFALTEYEGWTANGRQVFGCRGFGEIYGKFWKEFYVKYKPIYDTDDWPWSYFALNEEDEAKFREKWSKVIYFAKRDEDDEPYDHVIVPVDTTTESYAIESQLSTILTEEIRKEIAKELYKEMMENATTKPKDEEGTT